MADQTQATLSTQSESAGDRYVLRRLAGSVTGLAAWPIEQERRDLWNKIILGTRPSRPGYSKRNETIG